MTDQKQKRKIEIIQKDFNQIERRKFWPLPMQPPICLYPTAPAGRFLLLKDSMKEEDENLELLEI